MSSAFLDFALGPIDNTLLSSACERHIKRRNNPVTTPPILLEEYANAVSTPSDINQHLETLRSLAEEVDHVTEMGVRTGMSTRAFLCADVTLRSYDLFIDDGVAELFRIAREAGKDVR